MNVVLKLALASMGSRGMALAASAAAHVAFFAATAGGPGHASASPGQAVDAVQIDVDVEVAQPAEAKEEEKVPETPQPNALAKAPAPPTHTHPYPVAPDHDAVPHDPSLEHDHDHAPHDAPASEPSEAPSTMIAAAAAPRFTMTFGGAATAAGGRASSAGTNAGPAAAAPAGGDDGTGVVPESGVSMRAKLVERAPLRYPFGAEDLEADVGLEIVVDTAGRVESARVTRGGGHGFDDAALRAIRGYRFTPAERAGSRVRVRMPWVVEFRIDR